MALVRTGGTTLLIIALACAMLVTAPSRAHADAPPAGASWYDSFQGLCVYSESTGRFSAHGNIRSHVYKVPHPRHVYYQKVRIWIDRKVVGGDWRKLEAKKYRHPDFTSTDLFTYSTSGVRSPVGALIAHGGTLRVKAKVRLMRNRRGLPDTEVWRYTLRTPTFGCQMPSNINFNS